MMIYASSKSIFTKLFSATKKVWGRRKHSISIVYNVNESTCICPNYETIFNVYMSWDEDNDESWLVYPMRQN